MFLRIILLFGTVAAQEPENRFVAPVPTASCQDCCTQGVENFDGSYELEACRTLGCTRDQVDSCDGLDGDEDFGCEIGRDLLLMGKCRLSGVQVRCTQTADGGLLEAFEVAFPENSDLSERSDLCGGDNVDFSCCDRVNRLDSGDLDDFALTACFDSCGDPDSDCFDLNDNRDRLGCMIAKDLLTSTDPLNSVILRDQLVQCVENGNDLETVVITTSAPTPFPIEGQPETPLPTPAPSFSPSARPSANPTTSLPTTSPSPRPTTPLPTTSPNPTPTTPLPTTSPSPTPTTPLPTNAPTTSLPTREPTQSPEVGVTNPPTSAPSTRPSSAPIPPTDLPTSAPITPTDLPTFVPTSVPTGSPTKSPLPDGQTHSPSIEANLSPGDEDETESDSDDIIFLIMGALSGSLLCLLCISALLWGQRRQRNTRYDSAGKFSAGSTLNTANFTSPGSNLITLQIEVPEGTHIDPDKPENLVQTILSHFGSKSPNSTPRSGKFMSRSGSQAEQPRFMPSPPPMSSRRPSRRSFDKPGHTGYISPPPGLSVPPDEYRRDVHNGVAGQSDRDNQVILNSVGPSLESDHSRRPSFLSATQPRGDVRAPFPDTLKLAEQQEKLQNRHSKPDF